jgi:anaerobic selenocysteine-containing dehydrogenase
VYGIGGRSSDNTATHHPARRQGRTNRRARDRSMAEPCQDCSGCRSTRSRHDSRRSRQNRDGTRSRYLGVEDSPTRGRRHEVLSERETAYMLGKFARVALRTANIDYNGRFCMASAAAAGLRAFGIRQSGEVHCYPAHDYFECRPMNSSTTLLKTSGRSQ